MRNETIVLTKDVLERASESFREIDDFRIADEVIGRSISHFPFNNEFVGVYTKAILVNALYQTAILNISRMARHIVAMNIDPELQASDISVIETIRSGHGIKSSKGQKKEINFYSFATKYVHFHAPNSYPIYDNLVMKLVTEANKELNFHASFTQQQLLDYGTYKSVIDSLARRLRVVDWDYKRIDQGLWICAKYQYRRNELPPNIVQRLKQIIDTEI